jgi:hypothetical protein
MNLNRLTKYTLIDTYNNLLYEDGLDVIVVDMPKTVLKREIYNQMALMSSYLN